MLATTTHHAHRYPRLHRAHTKKDAQISPFLLDPSQVHFHSPPTQTRQTATWLHLSVQARLVSTRAEALHAVETLSSLRHPNLEQLLGAVADPRYPMCVLTERVPGPLLSDALAVKGTELYRFVGQNAKRFSLDVCRALVYLHAKVDVPHGDVCVENVVLDLRRCRAVLLLGGEGPRAREGWEKDVYGLAGVLRCVFQAGRIEDDGRVARVLRECLNEEVGRRPTAEEVCSAVTECFAERAR